MGWKNEALIMIGFVIAFVGIFLPHAFPASQVIVTESWVPFSSKEVAHLKPNWAYMPVSFIAVPFIYKAWLGIRAMPLWK